MNQLLKSKIKEFWPYLLVILVIIMPWFLKSGYLFMTDMAWGPNITIVWSSPGFLLNLIVKTLSFVFPVDFLEKIYITGILVLILLGGRKLVRAVLKRNDVEIGQNKNNGLVFILSLFALFNPFVYDRALYGQFGFLAAYSFLLFAIAYLIEVYQTLNLNKIYLAAITSALAWMFSFQSVFFLAPFYILFLIGLILKRSEINWRKIFFTLFLSSLMILVIDANWLFATISGTTPTISFMQKGVSQQDLIAFQTSGNGTAGTFGNVLLMSGFWGKDQFRYLDLAKTSGWQKSFILLTPIILYGIYLSFRRRSKNEKILSAGLLIIFCLAVILAVGIKAPVARSLTLFLYNHLPLYKGLREPQKLVATIIPIYLIFLSIGAAKTREWKLINKKIGLSALVLIVVVIMQAPSLIWGFNRQARPVSYPADWQEVDKFLLSTSTNHYPCSDKIIFLPWHLYMSFNWVGKIIVNPAPVFFSCPVESGSNMEWGGIYDNSGDPEGQKIEKWLADKGKTDNLNARYVILARELDWKTYDWLNNLTYLKLIKTTPSLLVYEREN